MGLLLLILWPLAELFVAIEVARAFGVPLTVLLLIASWPLGGWALRSQGRAAWRRFSAAVASGKAPARQAVDGALVLLGGLLLIVPGFITDVLGAVLLAPPTRAAVREAIARNPRNRVVVRATGFGRGGKHYDAESTAVDVDQPRLPS